MAFSVTQKKRARRQALAFLKEVGIPANLKGFRPLAESIAISAEFPDRANSLDNIMSAACKNLNMGYAYKPIFNNIDACITKCFKRCSQAKLDEYFGTVLDPEKGSLSVHEFICTAAYIVHDKTVRMREV